MRDRLFIPLNPLRSWFARILLLHLILGTGLGANLLLAKDKSNALFIHPLGLDLILNHGGNSSLPKDSDLEKIPVEVIDAGANSSGSPVRPPFILVNRPKEDGFTMGFIGYREAARWTSAEGGSEFAVLEITDNTGGSGNFSSIVKLEKTSDGEYVQRWRIVGGDRCNDGRLRIIELDGHQVIYAASATPFRLLNPVADSNWRTLSLFENYRQTAENLPPTLFGWRAYTDVANSAVSYAGEIAYRFDPVSGHTEVLGVIIDEESFLSETQGTMQPCINQWLRARMPELKSAEHGWIPLTDWIAGFQSLHEHCNL